MLPFLAGCLTLAAHAGGMVGVDWAPFSSADLAWTEAEQNTGTLVGEHDGLLVGPLRPWGGLALDHDAFLLGFAVARLATVSFQGEQQVTDRRTALRPSFDYRRYLRARKPGSALPWLGAGVHAVIPAVTYTNDTYSPGEQEALDETARQDRTRIGGAGGRLSGGAEVMWENGLLVGVRADLGLHRAQRSDEEVLQVSVLTSTDAAFVLGFHW